MKRWVYLFLFFSIVSCWDEEVCPNVNSGNAVFEMRDIPYVFQGDEDSGVRPYYSLTDRLDLLIFTQTTLDTVLEYDYAYCKEHQYIPVALTPGSYRFLFVANLMDHRVFDWYFTDKGILEARWRILNQEEPSVYLFARQRTDFYGPVLIPVDLRMVISRLEIRVVDPPSWVNGVDIKVEQMAGEISTDDQLRDTASVHKRMTLTSAENGVYWVGINTFPSYPGLPSLVNIQLKGNDRGSQFVINDDRIEFKSGRIIRLNIEFDAENKLTISVEVNGRWEVIDEGQIEI